ncbi:MAG: hypothetical protein ABJA49_13660 [Betaproteobacteria bacterium]
MVARQARLVFVPAMRYRVLAVVLVLHLALGWWLVSVTDRRAPELRQRALDPVVIQQVAVAPPEPDPVRPAELPPAPSPALIEPQLRPRAPAEQVRANAPQRAAAPQTADKGTAPAPAPDPAQTSVVPMQPAPTPAVAAAVSAVRAARAAIETPASGPATTPADAAAAASTTLAAKPSALPTRPSATPDMAVACPGQVAPVMPRLAIRGGVSGVVVAQALIVGGKVSEVRVLSGPPMFHNAVRTAMLQYRCVSNAAEVRVTQEFNFRLE